MSRCITAVFEVIYFLDYKCIKDFVAKLKTMQFKKITQNSSSHNFAYILFVYFVLVRVLAVNRRHAHMRKKRNEVYLQTNHKGEAECKEPTRRTPGAYNGRVVTKRGET